MIFSIFTFIYIFSYHKYKIHYNILLFLIWHPYKISLRKNIFPILNFEKLFFNTMKKNVGPIIIKFGTHVFFIEFTHSIGLLEPFFRQYVRIETQPFWKTRISLWIHVTHDSRIKLILTQSSNWFEGREEKSYLRQKVDSSWIWNRTRFNLNFQLSTGNVVNLRKLRDFKNWTIINKYKVWHI